MLSPALPVKDALRGLRTGLTAGRQAIRPLQAHVPPPVHDLVDGLLRQIDRIGHRVDREASRVVHSMLDQAASQPRRNRTLTDLAADPAGPRLFAERLYAGIEFAFERLSLPPELLSEAVAAHAFHRALRDDPAHEDSADLAAMLMIEAEARMFAPPPPFAARAPVADRRLALFAVMLWLLVDPEEVPDDEALLGVCIDAASAVGREVADLPDDRATLRRLLADYARLI